MIFKKINMCILQKGLVLGLTPLLFSSCASGENAHNSIIYKNSFTQSPQGIYTRAQVDKEWNTPPYANGIEEKRVKIIDNSDKNRVLKVSYPSNEFGIANTGAQWKLIFNKSYEEITLSYRLRFGENFDFVRGGKLPGLAGGTAPSGGKEVTGTNGWSGRIMWRKDGRIVQNVYHPDKPGKYGEDFAWNIDGEHYFQPGVWHSVQNHFVMNTPKKNDGVMQAWLDGVLVLDKHNMHFRDVNTFAIDLLYFSTFFGGSTQEWATSKDEEILFDDFKISH